MSQRTLSTVASAAAGDVRRSYSIAAEEHMLERFPVILNVKKIRTHAVHHTTALLGMKQVHFDRTKFVYGDPQWAVGWIDRSSAKFFRALYLHQKINHVPGVEQLSRKKMLAKAFSELVSSPYRSHFAIYPRSWTLMSDYEDLVKSMRHQRAKEHKLSVAYNAALQAYQQAKASQPNADITPPVPPPSPMTYIVKPGSACQGKGISLVMSPEKVKRVVGNVVQEYIANPLLIRGKKFDLRIYVLITSVAPLRMYVFQDGLARFCTEDYIPPAADNLNRLFGHLTNFSLNKANEKFVHNDDDSENAGDGSKWTLDGWNDYMASQYGEATLRTVWARIHGVLTKTILTSLPTMRTSYRELYPDESFAGHCFQLLGFDIMLDSELRPWLIEVNRNPSLRCDTPLDQKIKTAVLAQTFYILDASGYIKRLLNAERHAVSVLIQYVRNATQNSQSPTSSSTSPTSHQQQQSRSVSIDLAILTSLGLDPAHLPRNVAEKHLSRSEYRTYLGLRRAYELSLRLAHEDRVVASFARKIRLNVSPMPLAASFPSPSVSSSSTSQSSSSTSNINTTASPSTSNTISLPDTDREHDGSTSLLFAQRKPTESIVNLPSDTISIGLKPPRTPLTKDPDGTPYYSSCFQRLFPCTPFIDYATQYLPKTIEEAEALMFDPLRDLPRFNAVLARRGLPPLNHTNHDKSNDSIADSSISSAPTSSSSSSLSSFSHTSNSPSSSSDSSFPGLSTSWPGLISDDYPSILEVKRHNVDGDDGDEDEDDYTSESGEDEDGCEHQEEDDDDGCGSDGGKRNSQGDDGNSLSDGPENRRLRNGETETKSICRNGNVVKGGGIISPDLMACIEQVSDASFAHSSSSSSPYYDHIMNVHYTPLGCLALDYYHHRLAKRVFHVQKARLESSTTGALSARIEPPTPPPSLAAMNALRNSATATPNSSNGVHGTNGSHNDGTSHPTQSALQAAIAARRRSAQTQGQTQTQTQSQGRNSAPAGPRSTLSSFPPPAANGDK